jgi:hypothetical protein
VGFVFLGRKNLVAVGGKRNKFGGAVAKWKGKGLQSLYRRFDSASRLKSFGISEKGKHVCGPAS